MKRSNVTLALRRGILASCACLAACGNQASNINIRAQWGANLSEYGLTPLYPPREDVFVGDAFLYVQSPCKDAAVSKAPQSIFLGSIPESVLANAFYQYYGSRPELPSSSAKPATSPPSKPSATPAVQSKATISTPGSVTLTMGSSQPAAASSSTNATSPSVPPQPLASSSDPIFPFAPPKGTPRSLTRMRLAAFPDFSLSDFEGGGLGATIPLHGAGTVSGAAGAQNSSQVDVSVSQVEESTLPAPVLYRAILAYLRSGQATGIINPNAIAFFINSEEDQMAQDQGCYAASQRDPKPALIVFINRVFYARGFSYDFSHSNAFAATLKAAIGAGTGAGSGTTTSSSSPGSTSSSTSASSGSAAQTAADTVAKSIQSLAGSSPGVSSSIEVGSQGGLVLKQTFDRPLAFGVGEALTFTAQDILGIVEATGNRAASVIAPANDIVLGALAVQPEPAPLILDNGNQQSGDCTRDPSIPCPLPPGWNPGPHPLPPNTTLMVPQPDGTMKAIQTRPLLSPQ